MIDAISRTSRRLQNKCEIRDGVVSRQWYLSFEWAMLAVAVGKTLPAVTRLRVTTVWKSMRMNVNHVVLEYSARTEWPDSLNLSSDLEGRVLLWFTTSELNRSGRQIYRECSF